MAKFEGLGTVFEIELETWDFGYFSSSSFKYVLGRIKLTANHT